MTKMRRDQLERPKCDYCGRRFVKRRGWQRYCSTQCRNAAWREDHPRMVRWEGREDA